MAKYFVEFNNNPKQVNTGDCVVRALAKIFYKTWSDTIIELAKVSGITGGMVNETRNHQEYTKQQGYVKVPLQGLKLNINQITRIQEKYCTPNSGRSLRWAVRCQGHLTAVIDGKIFDTWDCGRRHVLDVMLDPKDQTWFKNEIKKLRSNVEW